MSLAAKARIFLVAFTAAGSAAILSFACLAYRPGDRVWPAIIACTIAISWIYCVIACRQIGREGPR